MNSSNQYLEHHDWRRFFAVVVAMLAIAGFTPSAFGASIQAEEPTPEEQAELEKFPVYNENVEVISPNQGNGLHEFLEQNNGKTVFIESAVLRYTPAPEGITAETRDKMPPTDRFENSVFQKCWGEEVNMDGRFKSGDSGFPLPLDQSDIEAGCATRIKFLFTEGDYGPNIDIMNGDDKREVFFVGFFSVEKEPLPDGKTLYRLTEVPQATETVEAFYKHATKKDRPYRKLWIDDVKTK